MKYPDLKLNDGITSTEVLEDVKRLQSYLVKYGESLSVDGKFGPKTEEAVKAFQAKQGLETDGRVTETVWLSLFRYPLVTISQLKSIYKNTKITAQQVEDLNVCLNFYQINTIPRIRHFLSQTGHESGGLRYVVELADGEAYNGREDLGNTQPGDGPKYKGAGVIQLTGRLNYTHLRDDTHDQNVLDIGCTYVGKTYPFRSAGVWWDVNKMNELCDKNPTVREVTKKVNGGYKGLEDREAYYTRSSQIIVNPPL